MTGRRSHGRLSALNGVVHQGSAYAFPRIGARPVSEVTTADILAILTPIWHEKPETARRVRQRVGAVM